MGSPSPGYFGADTSDTQGGVVHYRVKFTSPGASSPTFPLSASQGITSVTYSATGILTIVLANNFYQLLNVTGIVQQASFSAGGANYFTVTSNDPTTGTVVVVTRDVAGTAVATASGDVVMLDIEVQNYKSQ